MKKKINYNYILCRYGELFLKGKNRKIFIKQLLINSKKKLKNFSRLQFFSKHDRIFIKINNENEKKVLKKISYIFGYRSFSLAIKIKKNFNDLVKNIKNIINSKKKIKTFKILTRRQNKEIKYNSDQINRFIANEILKTTNLKVDLYNYDIGIIIEIRKNSIYIMDKIIYGRNGFPIGCQEKVLLLLSGGIDSPVAGYLMMKRGILIEILHFTMEPYTSKNSYIKVLDLAKKLKNFQDNINFYSISLTDIQLEMLKKKIPKEYNTILIRRFMFRIANIIANKKNCTGLVCGDSIGQVSSQTLTSIKEIENLNTIPIFRPLLTYDKNEIIFVSKKENFYNISIRPYKDCCSIFSFNKSVIKPKKKKILNFEKKINVEKLCFSSYKKIKKKII